jgi:hypothetical protein
MKKETLVTTLKEIDKELDALTSDINKSASKFVAKKKIMQNAESIAKLWFENVEPSAEHFNISEIIESKYHQLFEQLLELSLKPSRKLTYTKTIDTICANIKEELILVVIKSADKINSFSNLPNILENTTDEEKEYLNEALGCAKNGYLRASMVLLWCAAINRIHKKVEALGVEEFNKKSKAMKSITTGRFRRFSKSFDVVSIDDLEATVFDNDLLWVLEYWGLIDANQHERLQICFTMRNNAAHPGDATTTEQNLASAFSDIKNMVFDNPNLKLLH